MDTWRPIATAPLDVDLLLWLPESEWMMLGQIKVGWWNGGRVAGTGSALPSRPTHWMPLPDPPPPEPEPERAA